MNGKNTPPTTAKKAPGAARLLEFFTRSVREEARLPASAPDIWRWFTDFESFPSWNPFIRNASGSLRVGATLSIRLRLGKRIISFRPVVTAVEPSREVHWKTRVLVPGLFDVERSFIIEPAGTHEALFIQEETNTGLLVPLAYLLANMENELRAGFRDFSEALGLQAAARKRPPESATAGRAREAAAPNHAVQH